MNPSAQFTQSIAANVVYWQQRTKVLSDKNLAALDRERRNLYRAARYGLHLAETWHQTAELLLQSFVLVERRGYWREWIPLLEQLLAKCAEEDLPLRGRILNQLGLLYRHNQQFEASLAAHQEELQIGLLLKDKWRQAHACINSGVVYRLQHQYDKAESCIVNAQKLFQEIDAPTVKHAFVLLELGLLAQDQAQWATAEAHLLHSTKLWREVGDPFYLANGLKLLGQVLASQNKMEDALAAYQEALELLSQTENNIDKARVRNEIGVLYLKQENLSEARRFMLEADSSFLRQSGALSDQAIVANNLGNVFLAQGQLKEAESAFQRAVAKWKLCEDRIELANSLGGLAGAKAQMQDKDEAQKLYRQALSLLADYPHDVWANKLQKRYGEELRSLQSG